MYIKYICSILSLNITEWSGPIIKKWATSYGACEKVQTVDLWDEGVDAEVLDQIKPPIYISEW